MANAVTSIFNSIFGDDNTTKDSSGVSSTDQTGTVTENSQTVQDQKSTQKIGSVSQTGSTQTQDSSAFNRTLSDDQISAVTSVLSKMSASSPTDLSGIAHRISGANDATSAAVGSMLQRALGAEDSLNAGNADILAQAKKSGQINRDAQYQKTAGAAGSAFNSLAQQVFGQEDTNLDTSLAALGAQLATSNRQQATTELLASIDALQKQSGVIASSEGSIPALMAQIEGERATSISNLTNAIKGGVSTSATRGVTNTDTRTENQATTNTSTRTLTDNTNTKDLDLNTSVVTVGKDTTNSTTNLLDLLKALHD